MQISSEFTSDFFEKQLHYCTTIAPHKSCEKPANRRAASDEKPTPVIGSKIVYFSAKYRINFTTTTRSTIMASIRVTVPTENQTVGINNLFSLGSARSDLSFTEGFNLAEIIEMIDYVSLS